MKNLIVAISFFVFPLPLFCQYKNLVMEGAGIRGIAYTGAIKALEEKKLIQDIERVAGTSVGSLVGALICCGYSADELKDIMFSLEVQTFNDGRGFFIGGQRRLRKNFGWYRGEKIENWLAGLIEKKTGNRNLTFLQLHELQLQRTGCKDLFVTATNLTQQRAETFSWMTHPGMKITTAVRISVSVPLYFTAVFLNDSGEPVKKPAETDNYQVFVDGGILANYPLQLFDTISYAGKKIYDSTGTIGFKVERPEQLTWYERSGYIAPFRVNSFRQYIAALYNIVIENLNRSLSYEEERKRTIYINTNNIGAKVRKITKTQKQLLFDNGMNAANLFLSRQKEQ